MNSKTRTAARRLSIFLSIVLALSVLAAPAFAAQDGGNGGGPSKSDGPSSDSGGKAEGSAASDASDEGGTKSDHDGDADSDAGTTYTEDDDTVDDEGEGTVANDVVDDDDNAHPSGKDRSVENGASGNQGKAESDPDDDGRGPDRSNGGPDKPNGSGGVDESDQDGNNGCGNDDDFEDDNEGWCGKPDRSDEDSEVSDEVTVGGASNPCPRGDMNGDRPGCGEDDEDDEGSQESEESFTDVEGLVTTRPTAVLPDSHPLAQGHLAAAAATVEGSTTEVLGVTFERPASPAGPALVAATEVAGEQLAAPADAGLPRTGSQTGLAVTVALALLGAGATTVALARSRN